ncbi:MAG TPA: M48 family metallopeptidase [Hyphomonadaceae bacterium]|nr:M48 family metallopeptidase [Hyphomonadaceae bacterium]
MRIPMYSGRSRGGPLGALGGRVLLVFLIIVALGAWWFSNQKTGITGRRQMITVDVADEIAMGREAYMQVLTGQPILCFKGATSCSIQDAQLVDEVREIGDRLRKAALEWEKDGGRMSVVGDTASHLPAWGPLADKFNWEFNVIEDEKTANAFALPGGYVAVYSGILPYAKNADGLAAVMGHEIGHALARHGAERMSQQQVMQFGQVAAGAVFGDMGVGTQRMVMGALGAGAEVGVLLPYARSQESEADMIGLELMVRACFDPRETPLLWKRMETLGDTKGAPPSFLSTHPDSAARAKAFETAMPTAIKAYQAKCGALPPRAD